MKIMQNNLERQYLLYAKEFENKALEVLRSGWYILGKEVQAFDQGRGGGRSQGSGAYGGYGALF